MSSSHPKSTSMPLSTWMRSLLWLPLLTVPLSGCQRAPAPAAAPALVVAIAVHLTSDGSEFQMRYPVEAAARYANALAFRVGGKLIERRVRLGDVVHQGQVLALLDATDAQAQALSASAALESAEHRLVFAKQQLDRDQAQATENLIAAAQLEQTQDAYTAARSARDQAAAAAAIAHDNLRYNQLLADHDGVITSENANTGEVVAAGQAVYGLAWSGDIDATLDAAASDLPRIAIGQSARVSFTALPAQSFEARVRELSPAADPQSRGYRVKLTLLHPGTSIRLGLTGEATLLPTVARPVSAVSTCIVPATAIFHQGNSPAVWVIRAADSTLELRPVTVANYGERNALVTSGLRDGEKIVAAGVHTVFAGEHVSTAKPLFATEPVAATSATP